MCCIIQIYLESHLNRIGQQMKLKKVYIHVEGKKENSI